MDQTLDREETNRQRRWKPSVDDGIVVSCFKIAAAIPTFVWELIFYRSFLYLTRPIVSLICRTLYGGVSSAQHKVIATDLYKAVMNASLLILYFSVAWISVNHLHGNRYNLFFVFCLIFCFGRIVEVLSLVAVLAFDATYRPKGFSRPIVNTLWHFCEVIVAYAIVYVIFSNWYPEAWGVNKFGGHLSDSYSAPWFFSFATISTMGYFDFAPLTALPRLIVASEVLCGYFLLLVVLQRSFSQLTGTADASVKPQEDLKFITSSSFKWDENGVLSSESNDFAVGVIVIVRDPAGNFLTCRKAKAEDYEFSGKLCFPGGMVRKCVTDDIIQSTVGSAVNCVLRETGIDVSAQHLVPIALRQQVATSFTRNGNDNNVVVLAYFCQLMNMPSEIKMEDKSVQDVRWGPIPNSLLGFTPANALYAYAVTFPHLSQEERARYREELKGHVDSCNKANTKLGLPLVDLDMLFFL